MNSCTRATDSKSKEQLLLLTGSHAASLSPLLSLDKSECSIDAQELDLRERCPLLFRLVQSNTWPFPTTSLIPPSHHSILQADHHSSGARNIFSTLTMEFLIANASFLLLVCIQVVVVVSLGQRRDQLQKNVSRQSIDAECTE
jgi:hypothetical protein